MRPLLLLMGLVAYAHADGNPATGPCADLAACTKACARNARACTWGGHLAERSGLDSGTKAAALYEKACAKGDGDGCWNAGRLADRGDSATEADRKRSRAFFDRACSRRVLRGCRALAKSVVASDKVARKAVERAIALLKPACLKKDAAACDQIVELYTNWLHKPDTKQAAQYRDRACRARTGAPCDPQSSPQACAAKAAAATSAQQAASAANDKRFATALVKQRLVPVQLAERTWNENVSPERRPKLWRLDHVVPLRVGITAKDTVNVIVGFERGSNCLGEDRPAEYVRRDDKIYRVVRKPTSVATQSFMLCGCGPMCGGAMPARVYVGYEVPAGTSFGGPMDVVYDVDEVKVSYRDAGKCAPPP